MNTSLIVNAGSATYKYAVFRGRKKMTSYLYQKEGEQNYSFQKNGKPYEKISMKQFENSLSDLKKREKGIFLEIDHMAFRVVHGGEMFTKTTVVTRQVIAKLEKLNSLAPLHNPYAFQLLKQAQRHFPKIKKLLIFDTAFHVNLPDVNKTYALPEKIRKKLGLKRFGFHGIICSSIVHKMGWRLSKRTIICHLGSGCSVTAVMNGKSIDTSMGFTPLEGLLMGTRAGDLDPGIVLELQKKYGTKKTEQILNNESGLKALADTGDMREILHKLGKGNKKAAFALEIFCSKAAKHIASAVVSLKGVDHIIFSGGIGENAPLVRQRICEYLQPLGVKVHRRKNQKAKVGQPFQKTFSKVKLSYLHADETSEMNRVLTENRKN